jgi:hypothetical protein
MNDVALQLRAQIPSSTDPHRLERIAKQAERRPLPHRMQRVANVPPTRMNDDAQTSAFLF